jgi:hemoglobin
MSATPAANPPVDSLYARLGGDPVMKPVIDDYLSRVVEDPDLSRSFAGVDLARLKAHVVTFICSVTGGGCRYEGDNMKVAHAGLKITEAEMNHFVELLIEALDRHGVGLREKNELLAVLAPMKRDVVTR